MKQAISSALVLKIVDPRQPFVLETYASNIALGAILSQEGRPVAFESKKLSPSQQNLPVHEQELYAINHSLKV